MMMAEKKETRSHMRYRLHKHLHNKLNQQSKAKGGGELHSSTALL